MSTTRKTLIRSLRQGAEQGTAIAEFVGMKGRGVDGVNSLQLYKTMVLIRAVEDALQALCDIGQGADLHFSKGEEAIAVGVSAALDPADYILTHHRCIAHAIAKGVPLQRLLAEVLGLPSGLCQGRAGEMQLSYPPVHFMASFQLVGTVIPVAAGVGWALKNYKKSDNIVVAVCGDAATANGQFHEGLNIAAVNKVPMLLIVENNGLAGNVPSPYYLPCSIVERAHGYGIPAHSIDGNHVDEVQEAARLAADWVRENSRPYLLECNVVRLSKHKQGQGDMRSKEEIAELSKRDPLLYEERRLGIDPELKAQLLADAEKEVREAIDAAREEILR